MFRDLRRESSSLDSGSSEVRSRFTDSGFDVQGWVSRSVVWTVGVGTRVSSDISVDDMGGCGDVLSPHRGSVRLDGGRTVGVVHAVSSTFVLLIWLSGRFPIPLLSLTLPFYHL